MTRISRIERAEYGLDEAEIPEGVDDIKTLRVDGSIDSIRENPINKVLFDFSKNFEKNEIHAFNQFEELAHDLKEFSERREKYPIYEEMEIINLIKILLYKYNMWVKYMRDTICIANEKMQEVQNTVKEYYVTKEKYDNFKKEVEYALDAENKRSFIGRLRIDDAGNGHVVFSRVEIDKRGLKNGDTVFVSKG
jgi:hypothetical protein